MKKITSLCMLILGMSRLNGSDWPIPPSCTFSGVKNASESLILPPFLRTPQYDQAAIMNAITYGPSRMILRLLPCVAGYSAFRYHFPKRKAQLTLTTNEKIESLNLTITMIIRHHDPFLQSTAFFHSTTHDADFSFEKLCQNFVEEANAFKEELTTVLSETDQIIDTEDLDITLPTTTAIPTFIVSGTIMYKEYGAYEVEEKSFSTDDPQLFWDTMVAPLIPPVAIKLPLPPHNEQLVKSCAWAITTGIALAACSHLRSTHSFYPALYATFALPTLGMLYTIKTANPNIF